MRWASRPPSRTVPRGPAEPLDNVYTLHDYVAAGLGPRTQYRATIGGAVIDRDAVEQKFLQRSEYARTTGTPLFVGEFGPIYTGDARLDRQRRQILDDQLEIYRRYDAGFVIWTYKDLGRQGLTYARPNSPYGAFIADFLAKKERLGVDQWGGDGHGPLEVSAPAQDLVAREFPHFNPSPWGRFDWVRTLLLNITFAQPMAEE